MLTTHNTSLPTSKFTILFCCILITVLLGSCQSSTNELATEDTISPGSTQIETTIPNDQKIYWEAWTEGPHSDTYDLGKGPNTYCARCHSPQNWDPASTIDAPPNCVSCKFPHEPEPRIAIGNPLVPEEEWFSIGCEICHQMNDGSTSPEISWFNTQIGYHETESSSTTLCSRCHADSEPFLYHGRELGEDVHTGFFCTSCHDPHSTTASCGELQCHSDVLVEQSRSTSDHVGITSIEECLECHIPIELIQTMDTDHSNSADCFGCHQQLINMPKSAIAQIYHSRIHSSITCVACHDAAGLEVGPVDGQQIWVPFRTLQTPVGPNTSPYQSHHLQRQVDCQRCHFPENPWGLPMVIESKTP